MKQFKKTISLLVVLMMMVVTLGACSNQAPAPTVAPTEEPVATEEAKETEEPEATEEAKETEEPEATEEVEEVKETEDPVATEEAKETEDPVATEEAKETEEPEATEEAKETEDPVATEEAKETEDPVATEEAKETEEPEATEEAKETEEPVATEEVKETEEPEATEEAKETEEPEATEEAGDTTVTDVPETTIKDKITMGTNAEFAPFEFIGDDGTVQGIDAEIAAEIAKDLGVELEISNMSFDSLLPALSSGKIDIILAGMTISEERKATTTFSDPYFNATQVIIVAKENPAVAGPEDLAGKKIGVQLGTTGDLYTDDLKDVEVSRFNKGLDAVMDLASGRLDCVIIDLLPATSFVNSIDGVTILELDEDLTKEEYGIAVKADDPALLDAINATIKRLQEDGTMDAIVAKYMDMAAAEADADAEAPEEAETLATEEPVAEDAPAEEADKTEEKAE